ncbi:uncharacterized protein LOC108160476 isoform X1 [Drosophila miranda]|uniref:uncharacterized protein LOC108160476 isoform X1 n=1 Tax=Drosophila miranda TaxID=7229 RepID=UPI00143F772C|nr:uncharacterized protein LOC108160476 isoform X1 [Drosophila miranda]
MECRAIPILPNYAQACGDVYMSPLPRKRSLCHTLFAYRTLNDPVIILITLAVVVGSFCLLSGFILLCVVSKAWQDETSEAILLMAVHFQFESLPCRKMPLLQRLNPTWARHSIHIARSLWRRCTQLSRSPKFQRYVRFLQSNLCPV